MIHIENLHKAFGQQEVLRGIDFNMRHGERVIMTGQNGAGKTTLIRCMLGEYRPDQGSVSIASHCPVKERVAALKHIGFVPQTPPPLKMTVKELIEYTSGIMGFKKDIVAEYCDKLELDISSHMMKAFYKLSGGMKQKLLISIAFSGNAEMLIFDEPTANLDPHGRSVFRKLLESAGDGKTFLFISHRLEEVAGIVTRSVELDTGRITKDEEI